MRTKRLIQSELLTFLFSMQFLLVLGGTAAFLLLESLGTTGIAVPWSHRWRHVANNFMLWVIAVTLFNLLIGAELSPVMPWLSLERIGFLYLTDLPFWLHALLGFLLYDLADYLIHRLSHEVPWLWRLHSVHHADNAMDTSSFVRAHPLHLGVTLFWKTLAMAAIGAPYWVVILRESLTIPVVQLHHAAVRWPLGLERLLRLAMVTPAMHRLHHSPNPHFTDSNYGSLLPWWDMCLGTYTRAHQASADQRAITGLHGYADPRWQRVQWMLVMPWSRASAARR